MSDHPGVSILSPTGRHGHRLKWKDPRSGEVKRETLPKSMQDESAKAARQRRDAAVRKSNWLALQREKVREGDTAIIIGKPLKEAAQAFYDSRSSDRTAETYGEGCGRFLEFLATKGVRKTDKVRQSHLTAFVTEVRKVPREVATRNKWIRSVKTMLRHWIKNEATGLTYEAVKNMETERPPQEMIHYLTPKKIQKLLRAAIAHDQATYSMTRREKATDEPRGGTPRYEPIAPYALFMLLTGQRRGSSLLLRWRDVDLDHATRDGVIGKHEVRARDAKNRRARDVKYGVSPLLRQLMVALHVRTGGHPNERVFADLTEDGVVKAKLRLRKTFGAPADFDWQACRRTCATYLVNSAIFTSPTHQTAGQLGHTVKVLQESYAGRIDDLDRDARTLEELYGIRKLGAEIIRAVSSPAGASAPVRGLRSA